MLLPCAHGEEGPGGEAGEVQGVREGAMRQRHNQ